MKLICMKGNLRFALQFAVATLILVFPRFCEFAAKTAMLGNPHQPSGRSKHFKSQKIAVKYALD